MENDIAASSAPCSISANTLAFFCEMCDNIFRAEMVELVDTRDLKSLGG